MPLPTNTTRLEAVNTILMVFGTAPVNSITPPYTSDVAFALATLDESLKEVLSEGWYFQKEYEVPFTPDINGEIAIPADILSLDSRTTEVYPKEGKLYNLEQKTFVWSGEQKLDVVYWRDWDDIPETARKYTTNKAARKFFERRTDHSSRTAALYQEEAQARLNLQREEADQADHSIFHTREAYHIIMRHSPLDTMGLDG